jgi:hypothetical protein
MPALRSLTMAALLALAVPLRREIARAYSRHVIEKLAPLVLKELDPFMPALLRRCSGAQLERIFRSRLQAVSGRNCAGADLGPLFVLFDPRVAADRAKVAAVPETPELLRLLAVAGKDR